MSPPPESGLCDRFGFCCTSWIASRAISLSDVLVNSDFECICTHIDQYDRNSLAESTAFTTGLTALQYRQQDN